jgi:hypothetical protein
MIGAALLLQAPGASAGDVKLAQASSSPSATTEKSAADKPMPSKTIVRTVKMRGTVDAIDKDKGTVTLKGPKGGKLTLDVQDKSKLDAVNVGDPVVATYVEALAFQLVKSGTGTPGVTAQEARVSSKPGETPAGAIGQQITATVTVTAINKKAGTVTFKGPQGNSETIKAQDPKNLDLIKVGDLVDITYTQALAVSLDKPAAAPKK